MVYAQLFFLLYYISDDKKKAENIMLKYHPLFIRRLDVKLLLISDYKIPKKNRAF